MASNMAVEKKYSDVILGKENYYKASLPMAPDCFNVAFDKPTPTPAKILFLLGGADDYTLAKFCVNYAEKMKKAGGDVEVIVKEGWHHGWYYGKKPWRVKNAMTLPLKVIPPISTVIKDKIIIKLIAERLLNSDQAKKKEDKPPNPLNSATISGIEVIYTFKAKAEPIKAPSSTAESTSTGFTISMTVTSTAKSIPMELTTLPLAAVLSFESIFKA